ncbi:MAG: DUF2892 domain-containing protein [Nitrospirales bacterium]
MPKSAGRKRKKREAERQERAQHAPQETQGQNVGAIERLFSTLLGSLMLMRGLSSQTVPGLAVAATGAALLYRGATGHCTVYESFGLDTNHDTMTAVRSIDRVPEAAHQDPTPDAPATSSLGTEEDQPTTRATRRKGTRKALAPVSSPM